MAQEPLANVVGLSVDAETAFLFQLVEVSQSFGAFDRGFRGSYLRARLAERHLDLALPDKRPISLWHAHADQQTLDSG